MPHLLAAVRVIDHHVTDRKLLAAYAGHHDQTAFAELVRRHAAMVHRAAADVCPHEAEDITQATFALLAERCSAVADREFAAGWLFETARRVALKARTATSRRAKREAAATAPRPCPTPHDELTFGEVRAIVAEETAGLPDRLRVPLVLCYWEGATATAAADRLGCSPREVKRRLAAGRDRLAARLARRGVVKLAAGVFLAAAFALAVGVGPRAGTDTPAPPTPAAPPAPRTDTSGDPLPAGAVARMGSLRWRHHEEYGNQLHVVPSPTGKHVATAAVGVGAIRVWDLADGRQLCEFPWENGAGYEVRFTPDGSRVFYLAERGVVRYFDPLTGKPTGETTGVIEKDTPHRVRGTPDKWNEQWTAHRFTLDGRWVLTSHPESATG
jgi:RNA polymerase sigma factor (sigma-70 family)